MGQREPTHFSTGTGEPFGVWDIKGLAELVANIVAPGQVTLVPTDGDGDLLWTIMLGDRARGHVSRVPLDAPVWASPAFGVELVLDQVSNADIAPAGEHAHTLEAAPAHYTPPKYRPLPTTPASEFDLALLVPDAVRAADVERVVRTAAGDLLERLVAFDVYEGAGVAEGTRSVAWRLTLRHPERTLRDKEIEGRRSKILSALKDELNVRQRST